MKIHKISAICLTALLLITAGCGTSNGKATSSLSGGSSSVSLPLPSSPLSTSSENPAAVLVESSKPSRTEEKIQKKLGYIRAFDEKLGTITLDPIEWITSENGARLRELKISEEDLPNGYYIYNPSRNTEKLTLSEEAKLYLLNRNSVGTVADDLTDRAGLARRIRDDKDNPFELQIQNAVAVQVTECYIP